MTQAGFAGNLRYVALPAALVCVLAGAGWVWLVRAANARFGVIAAAALALVRRRASPSVRASSDIHELDLRLRSSIEAEADLYGTSPRRSRPAAARRS